MILLETDFKRERIKVDEFLDFTLKLKKIPLKISVKEEVVTEILLFFACFYLLLLFSFISLI